MPRHGPSIVASTKDQDNEENNNKSKVKKAPAKVISTKQDFVLPKGSKKKADVIDLLSHAEKENAKTPALDPLKRKRAGQHPF